MVVLFWRRAWDSNPRGFNALPAFQAGSLATRSTLRITLAHEACLHNIQYFDRKINKKNRKSGSYRKLFCCTGIGRANKMGPPDKLSHGGPSFHHLFQDGEDSFCQSILFENTFMAHFFILKTLKSGRDPNAACVMQRADT